MRFVQSSLSKLFTSAEYAIRAGIVLGDKSYAVHQCETNPNIDLVYGRTGDAVSGSGACVARAKNADGDKVYAAISYEFPSLSANAVPELVDLLDRHLKMTGNIASTSSNVGNA